VPFFIYLSNPIRPISATCQSSWNQTHHPHFFLLLAHFSLPSTAPASAQTRRSFDRQLDPSIGLESLGNDTPSRTSLCDRLARTPPSILSNKIALFCSRRTCSVL
jgi:hypothetical protein